MNNGEGDYIMLKFNLQLFAVDDAYTQSLLHFNGDMVDEAGGVWTSIGSPLASTAQSKFSSGSLYLNGTSQFIGSGQSFAIGTGDYTVDFWIYLPTALSTWGQVYSGSAGAIALAINANMLSMGHSGIADECNLAATVPIQTWTHIAAVRASGIDYIYVGGVCIGSLPVTTSYTTSTMYIGCDGGSMGSRLLNAYIDEFRVSVGVARWTSNFTPPTAEYSVNTGSQLLNPETGWTRYDDTDINITYSGFSYAWYASLYGGGFHWSSTAGATATFNFTGTKLRLIGALDYNRTTSVFVYIDGVKVGDFNQYLTSALHYCLDFTTTGLADGTHYVKIVNNAAGPYGGNYVFDAIDISSSGSLKPYAVPTTIGSQLIAPEDGWTRYDDSDTNITFIGEGWWHNIDYNMNGGGCTLSSTSVPDRAIRFSFTGTKIRLVTAVNPTSMALGINVVIDGVSAGLYDQTGGATMYKVLVFEADGFSNSLHHVDIQSYNSSGYIYVDCIDIYNSGGLASYDAHSIPLVMGVSGCKLWLDASTIVGYNDGDSVGLWSDISSNGNDAVQVTTANMPVYKINAVNGKPALKFDGSKLFNLTTSIDSNSGVTIFVVVNKDDNNTDYYQSILTTTAMGIYSKMQSHDSWGVYSTSSGVSYTGVQVDNTYKVLSVVKNGSISTLWTNGVESLTVSGMNITTIFAPSNILGSCALNVQGLIGSIAEVIVFNGALSDSDRQAVETYLDTKYLYTPTHDVKVGSVYLDTSIRVTVIPNVAYLDTKVSILGLPQITYLDTSINLLGAPAPTLTTLISTAISIISTPPDLLIATSITIPTNIIRVDTSRLVRSTSIQSIYVDTSRIRLPDKEAIRVALHYLYNLDETRTAYATENVIVGAGGKVPLVFIPKLGSISIPNYTVITSGLPNIGEVLVDYNADYKYVNATGMLTFNVAAIGLTLPVTYVPIASRVDAEDINRLIEIANNMYGNVYSKVDLVTVGGSEIAWSNIIDRPVIATETKSGLLSQTDKATINKIDATKNAVGSIIIGEAVVSPSAWGGSVEIEESATVVPEIVGGKIRLNVNIGAINSASGNQQNFIDFSGNASVMPTLNKQIVGYVNEANNLLTLTYKRSDGTTKTGVVQLS